MQTLLFRGEEVERIVNAGLISTGMALFTAQDNVRIRIYRGDKNMIALKVIIKKKKEHETNSHASSVKETVQGEPVIS